MVNLIVVILKLKKLDKSKENVINAFQVTKKDCDLLSRKQLEVKHKKTDRGVRYKRRLSNKKPVIVLIVILS